MAVTLCNMRCVLILIAFKAYFQKFPVAEDFVELATEFGATV